MMAFFLIPWLLILALPSALLLSIIVRGLTLPKFLRGRARSVCGVCHYEVTPGYRDTCPECGRPYLKGGILTRLLAKQMRPGVASILVSWTLLCLLLGGFVLMVVSTVGFGAMSQTTRFTYSQTFRSTRDDGNTPTGVAGYDVRFDADLTTDFVGPVKSGALTVSIRPDSGPTVLVAIDPVTLDWQASGGDRPRSGGLFDAAAAQEALVSAGIDVSTAYVRREADLLADAVEDIHRDPTMATNTELGWGQNPSTSSFPHRSGPPAGPWTPFYLDVTASGTNADGDSEYQFESVVTDTARGVPEYEGRISLVIDDTEPRALRAVRLTLRPSEGWPVEMVYDPARKVATLTRGDQTNEYQADTHHAAVLAARDE
ncbi:MAG: hypothetical protein K8E66_03510, partial [Phycisphaerales bacterium]|nr:hypothetical protein [Phycisphaerales bacterium]